MPQEICFVALWSPPCNVNPHTLVNVLISLRQDPGDLGTIPLDRAFLQLFSSEVEASESTHSPSFQARTPFRFEA